MTRTQTAENRIPTRFSTVVFWGKATLLKLRRAVQDTMDGVRRLPRVAADTIETEYPHILAASRTPLYVDMDDGERALQLGKAQNLRCALRHLNGMVLSPDTAFSFWKQVGRATRRRGYVAGRQLREGCLFPAIGGGLCQLSNALYDAALQASCEIMERHPHTYLIPGSAAARNRDAAIAWNYIDLRFRSHIPLCLETVLTRDELIVRFRAAAPPSADRASASVFSGVIPLSALSQSRPSLAAPDHSCVTCGVSACFRHDAPEIKHLRAQRTQAAAGGTIGKTAYVVDAYMPELDAYITRQRADGDLLFAPLDGTRWKQPRYAWATAGYARVYTATLPSLWRAFQSRRVTSAPARRQAQLDGAERLAAHFARALPWDVSHLVVAQSLLPFLWRDGHLGGRTFDVLMTRLPMETLQDRLDTAFAAHPERALLRDFRADVVLVRQEMDALRAARHILTPHVDIAALFAHQAIKLDWQMPQTKAGAARSKETPAHAIAFPGPTHARKGAYEVRSIARALHLEVVLTGSELEGKNFWAGVQTHRVSSSGRDNSTNGDWLKGVAVVVQPAIVEDRPLRLLEALARGVPVIVTPACGLGSLPGVTTVSAGDESALCEAITRCLFLASAAPRSNTS